MNDKEIETLRTVNEMLKRQHADLCEVSEKLLALDRTITRLRAMCENALIVIAESELLSEEERA